MDPQGGHLATANPGVKLGASQLRSQASRLLPLTIWVGDQQCGDILLILSHLVLLYISHYLAGISNDLKEPPLQHKPDTEKQQQTAHRLRLPKMASPSLPFRPLDQPLRGYILEYCGCDIV